MQVVVDSDATAKALLSNGQLRNRVTIIPLNKVSFQSGHMLTVLPLQGKRWLVQGYCSSTGHVPRQASGNNWNTCRPLHCTALACQVVFNVICRGYKQLLHDTNKVPQPCLTLTVLQTIFLKYACYEAMSQSANEGI